MRRFEPIVALGGALLFGSLFVTWYDATGSQEFPVRGQSAFDALGSSGWQAFTGVDLVLAVLAVVIVVCSAGRAGMAAGAPAAVVVLFRMIDPPGPDAFVELGPGAWLALAGALTTVIGGLLVRNTNVRPGEPIAGLGGVLLLVSLFAPWYRDGVYVVTRGGGNTETVSVLATGDLAAWRVFAVVDVLLALLAAIAIAVPVVARLADEPAKPIAAAVIASAAGPIAIALVVFRLIDTPTPYGDLQLRPGAWLALAGALIAWIGSWMALRDESTPGAEAPDVALRPAPPVAAA
jgi:hypothetical protein